MAMTANDLRKGMVIMHNNDLCQVVDVEFVRPGNWRAMAQTKLKNLKTGAIFQQRFQTTEKVDEAIVESRLMQYLYKSANLLHFMDTETFEQLEMEDQVIGDQIKFLKEEMEVYVKVYEGIAIGVELPPSVDLEVIEAPPNVKGNSATSGNKPVTCEGGHVVNVPMFIESGEFIRVDTRTGDYLERTKN
ncbi:MAG: elongation factor P [Candidatus Rifleibacteriota bacterium]